MQAKDLQRRLGLKFKSPGLLDQALTHPSYLNENPSLSLISYQRLEFLGDAVISSVIALKLFQCSPDLTEGQLTKLRSHLVQEKSLAQVAARLDLGSYLRVGKGEEASGGRSRESNLAAVFEALVGAIFLDRGFDAVKAFILDCMREEMERALQSGVPQDPKVQLQELVQNGGGESPRYRVVNLEGPEHGRSFTVEVLVGGQILGAGCGKRRLDAEREAARRALETLLPSGGPPQA